MVGCAISFSGMNLESLGVWETALDPGVAEQKGRGQASRLLNPSLSCSLQKPPKGSFQSPAV